MFIKENIMLAIAGLKSNKMRSLLTMLGIIIGIASVIGVVSVGNAMTSTVTSQMSSMGATNITVNVQEKSTANKAIALAKKLAIDANSAASMQKNDSKEAADGSTAGGPPGGGPGGAPNGGGAPSGGGGMPGGGMPGGGRPGGRSSGSSPSFIRLPAER